MPLDLTPFGFTPTENTAYGALLALGPAGGYAVARQLGIARANAYQALDGLVTKGAAAVVDASPKRYRAVQPTGLFAKLVEASAARLDRLQAQLLAEEGDGGPTLVPLEGARAVSDVAMRVIVRAAGPARCVAPATVLSTWAPALRAREAAGRRTTVWVVGTGAGSWEVPVGTIDAEAVLARFGSTDLVLLEADGALLALGSAGLWSEFPLIVGLVRSTIDLVTA